jgi:Ser/Thr protein kinase RdoA (MazF antagonist)
MHDAWLIAVPNAPDPGRNLLQQQQRKDLRSAIKNVRSEMKAHMRELRTEMS